MLLLKESMSSTAHDRAEPQAPARPRGGGRSAIAAAAARRAARDAGGRPGGPCCLLPNSIPPASAFHLNSFCHASFLGVYCECFATHGLPLPCSPPTPEIKKLGKCVSRSPPCSWPSQEDLNLPEAKQALILQMPPEQQWQMVQSHRLSTKSADEKHTSAEEYLVKIRETLQVCTRAVGHTILRSIRTHARGNLGMRSGAGLATLQKKSYCAHVGAPWRMMLPNCYLLFPCGFLPLTHRAQTSTEQAATERAEVLEKLAVALRTQTLRYVAALAMFASLSNGLLVPFFLLFHRCSPSAHGIGPSCLPLQGLCWASSTCTA